MPIGLFLTISMSENSSIDLETCQGRIDQAVASGELTSSAAENIRIWLADPCYQEYVSQVAEHVRQGKWKVLDDVFWTVIPFGTGGRRGRMYPIGSNAINGRTIGESAQGLAEYVRQTKPDGPWSAAIAYDTRHRSREFAELCAGILVANGFQVYFKKDIRKKDKFQIMYKVFLKKKKKIIESGEILFANLKLSGQDNALYYFNNDGNDGHYDKNGKSVQKALMKTPINGARLSSSFGMRKHPIDGFNKMHRGTDFAAPKGTPIMASGNGIIKKAGWCGGGGNCIRIRHNSTYETIYAHMSKFARGIKNGTRVKQGQTIGYVGSTGKSTGPHLHYEVIINGKKVNSQKLKLPSGKILKGKEREIFETTKIMLNVLKSEKIIGLN